MKPTSLMVCKGLIPPAKQETLIPLLPENDQALFHQLPPPQTFDAEHLKWDLLDHIHPSWIAPYLRTLSEPEVRAFLSTLSTDQAGYLEKTLRMSNHLPKPNKLTKGGLRTLLLNDLLHGKELVPFAFLPKGPYNALLTLTQKNREKLVRYLGLHDLSHEMRQIIDKKRLQNIFDHLTQKEAEYLNHLVLHREPLTFKRQWLAHWDGSKEMLHKLLAERGANRLGHALYFASDSLTWYLTHSLEMPTGTLVLKYIEKPMHARAEELLEKQITKIFDLLTSGEKQ